MSETPDHVVFFDGVCNFCAASAQFIIRHDQQGVIRFAPIQSPLGQETYRRHGLDPANLDTFMFLTGGRALLRSDAAIEVAVRFGGLWKLARVFKLVPRPLRDWVYGIVARHRYQWFGRTKACMVPSPEIRSRFIA
jgi:predicted DCC family thiol-disulfide oxidoreductase YuxK